MTLAVSILVEDIIVLAEPLTGGVNGIFAPDIELFSINFNRYGNIDGLYWLILLFTALLVILYKNILRSPLGRSFAAVRDSEISALAIGVNVARVRTVAFAISCFITGIAGAFFGHFVTVFNYETFNVVLSINLLLMIVIGGLGSIHGAFFGAIIVGILPILISFSRDRFLDSLGINLMNFPGIETGLFSLILILFILFEPFGIYGRWLKIRTYFQLFPLYRKDMFMRQKSYLKTEEFDEFLELKDVTIKFGGITAVDKVCLEIKKGEILSWLVQMEKSTVFNMISRLYVHNEGEIFFDGTSLNELKAFDVSRAGIARTFQNIELFENATVLQNLLVGTNTRKTSNLFSEILFTRSVHDAEVANRIDVEEIMDFLNLQPYREKYIMGLSYGTRKIVELARALVLKPKLLLLDEPASGLSAEETADLAFWIEDIKNIMGITILMVEHNLNLVNKVADRVAAIVDGKVIRVGSPKEVQSDPKVIEAYIGA